MKFVILSNGDAPSKELLLREMKEDAQLLCCDGAAKVLEQYNLKPDLMIGDFDSLGEEQAAFLAQKWAVERLKLHSDKDQTDMHVALELAAQAGATKIVILGALGGRFDHALANVHLMVSTQRKGIETVMYDDKNEIRVCCNLLVLQGEIGDFLSLIPLGVNCKIRCTDGLQYPLYDHEFDLSDSLGVSNRFVEKEALVEVAHGWFCVIRAKD